MTVGLTPVLVRIADDSQAAEARRTATQLARTLGFGEELAGRVAIIASEIASNLVKHAREGHLHIRACAERCIELLAFDRGPGMTDTAACLRDGFSTAGTAGTGLGAVRRLASEFDVYSQPQKGTVVLARVDGSENPEAAPHIQTGLVQAPARGETVCGDAWTIVREARAVTMMVADGLGHGPFAAEASQRAARIVESAAGADPGDAIQRVHGALRSTRGAAVAIARIVFDHGLVRYSGLGNINAVIYSSTAVQRLVSHNGTAGAQAPRIQQFEYRWPPNALLVMHSDGLTARWELNNYPGLAARHPATISAVLYRDHNRGRDDAIVVTLKASG